METIFGFQIVDFLAWSIFIVICLSVWKYIVKSIFRGIYRQKLFELRNLLFDSAMEGGCTTFDSEQYKQTNERINRMIQFAHRASLGRVITMTHIAKWSGIDVTEDSKRREECIERISDIKEKALYTHINRQVINYCALYILSSNLLICISVVVAVILSIAWAYARKRIETPRRALVNIINAPLIKGSAEATIYQSDHADMTLRMA